jgi:ankyrin repeat protein/mono/diheme cytochrome c family protein
MAYTAAHMVTAAHRQRASSLKEIRMPLPPLRAGSLLCASLAIAISLPTSAAAQTPSRVDFARDVQPLLRQNCVSCHGPSQQMAGLRLDRRRDAMRGSTFGTVIGPGNGEASRLYLRVSGTQRGTQMPPTGALGDEQIALLKAWIDEGAEWPDALSGDVAPVPADPGAVQLMALLRAGDAAGFRRALAAAPAAATRNGSDGITPLMYAALYGTADAVRALLDAGANPNAKNDAGATALLWAVDDAAKTRLLIARGADVNQRSLDGRTPLMVAAAQAGSSEVLALLLDAGADPNVDLEDLTALGEAAYAGDVAAMQLLMARGADPKKGAMVSIIQAAAADCVRCIELLIPSLDEVALGRAALAVLPPNDDGRDVAMLLDAGANVNAVDRQGRSVLMRAAASDTVPPALVQRLLSSGADVHAKARNGETALAFANPRGNTPTRNLLAAAGGTATSASPIATPSTAKPSSATPRDAVIRALPILQQTGVTFRRKAGCVSCHNNTLTARVTTEASRAGIRIDDAVSRSEVQGIAQFLETWRERALQGLGIPGDADTVSYIMLGLADEQHPADPATDAMARFLKRRQLADGSWRPVAHRPPIESTSITVTALSLRALQLYSPAPMRAAYQDAARAGGRWLAAQTPGNTEERASQLLGMKWAGQGADRIGLATRALIADQRLDGGWAQLPTLESDAYATGQALVAMHDAGGVPTTDPAYQRGVAFLLRTQHADGTWHVASRALAIQPLFDIGFPHGNDSWISAAGTNWATTALALAVQGQRR